MSSIDLVTTLLNTASSLSRRLDRSLSAIKGITFSEYQLLAALRDQPSATATRVDLATALSVTPSGVTRALKPLEKLGFVETTKDARDARKSLATLTAAGHELITDADGVVSDIINDLSALNALTTDDRQRLQQLFESLPNG